MIGKKGSVIIKTRLVKKHAKAFMAGVWEYPVKANYHPAFDGNGVYKAEYVLPVKDLREFGKLVGRRGWDGRHWDAPTHWGVGDGKTPYRCEGV